MNKESTELTIQEMLRRLDKETNISDELFELISRKLMDAEQKERDAKNLVNTLQFNLSKLNNLY